MAGINVRIEAVRSRLIESGLDALVVQSGVNRRYLSGFTGSAGALVIGLHNAWIMVDFRYVEQAARQASEYTQIQFRNLNESLAALMGEQGFARAGFEAGHTSVQAYNKLKADVPDVTWVPTEQWIETARGRKDKTELANMQRAIDLADDAWEYIQGVLQPGRSEREIALELEFYMRRRGADRLAFDSIVASGPNGSLPHAVPTERPLQTGDLVTLDFGCVLDGYCSDITRTVAIGAVDPKAKDLYELVLSAQLAGLAAVSPGKTGIEVDAVARQVITDAGYGEYFGHGLGHGIGLEVHEEFPRLSPRGEVVLQPGMVCSVEPGVYLPGWGGIRIEDLVVVTDDGCRVLTRSDKQLRTL